MLLDACPCMIPRYSVVLFLVILIQSIFAEVCKKVRLLNFSPFDVFRMPWWMGHCFVRTSSGSVEQKITNATASEKVLICFFEYKNQGGSISVTGNLTRYTVIAPPNTLSCSPYALSEKLHKRFIWLNFPLKCNNHHGVCKKKDSLPASLKQKWQYCMFLRNASLLHNVSGGLLLWIVSQKRFVLRMKLIQCEIKSPVLYLREAHRGHSWCWASRLCSISAHCSTGILCMRLHDKTCPFIHAKTQHWYTYCTHVIFKLFYIRYSDVSILISFLAWANKSPQRCISLHKGQVLPPTASYFFFSLTAAFSRNALRIHHSSI